MQNFLFLTTLLVGISSGLQAQSQSPTRFQPSHQEMIERYKRATHIDSITKNAVTGTTIEPHWSAGDTSFWYVNTGRNGQKEYFQVDATSGKKTRIQAPASDTAANPAEPRRRQHHDNALTGILSPDQKWQAYIEKGNLFVKSTGGNAKSGNTTSASSNATSTNPIQFTTDGTENQPYGDISWSPDSKYLAGYRIHPVKDTPVHIILTSVPGTTRGQLRTRPYKQPGDPFTTRDPYLFRLDTRSAIKIDAAPIDFPEEAPEFHWHADNPGLFTYEKFDRGHQRMRVIEVDAATGKTRNIIDEKTNTFIYFTRVFMYYPKGSNWLIRSSEQDGWRHLYLVDLKTGREKAITKGNWVVRNVDSVDLAKKEIWFSASGMNPGEDPYLIHYYRIGLDGRKLTDLTPEKGNHSVSFSPTHKYYIDNYSLVNVPPVTKLRRSTDGKEIAIIATADMSYYKTLGVSPPEPFVAKGRDGQTDIYGIVSRPSDFDPHKKYPVLENIYAGPHDNFVPKSFVPYSEMQSLAELGFIVVMIDGMGTANRSKAFHDICWKNIADAGLPDRIAWIKALAAKDPSVDTTRVGIYGTSAGGQNSFGALLFHPEFYKACASACGCHDNRVDKQWWNEQWMGYPVGPQYDQQSNVTNAYKLQGHALLIVGEADSNVPPESTYRVADALIRAGKTFDFLAIPGMDHSDGGPFGRLKKRNFFVQHLLEVTPPDANNGEFTLGKELGRERWSFQ